MLSLKQVSDYCLAGPKTCKFFDTVQRSDNKYVNVCTKLSQSAYEQLKQKHWGDSEKNYADNCAGYLYLTYKLQGYDK